MSTQHHTRTSDLTAQYRNHGYHNQWYTFSQNYKLNNNHDHDKETFSKLFSYQKLLWTNYFFFHSWCIRKIWKFENLSNTKIQSSKNVSWLHLFTTYLYEMLNQHSTPFDFSSCPVRTMKAEPEFALSWRSGSAFALVPAVRMPLKFITICLSSIFTTTVKLIVYFEALILLGFTSLQLSQLSFCYKILPDNLLFPPHPPPLPSHIISCGWRAGEYLEQANAKQTWASIANFTNGKNILPGNSKKWWTDRTSVKDIQPSFTTSTRKCIYIEYDWPVISGSENVEIAID